MLHGTQQEKRGRICWETLTLLSAWLSSSWQISIGMQKFSLETVLRELWILVFGTPQTPEQTHQALDPSAPTKWAIRCDLLFPLLLPKYPRNTSFFPQRSKDIAASISSKTKKIALLLFQIPAVPSLGKKAQGPSSDGNMASSWGSTLIL